MGIFRADNRDQLYLMLGNGDIVLDDQMAKSLRRQSENREKGLFTKIFRIPGLSKSSQSTKKEEKAPSTGATETKPPVNMKETYVLRYDDKGANFKFSGCCCPIPGDNVIGFVGDDNEVTIHALDCPRALAMKASYGPRIVATKWARAEGKFLASVHIEGIDRFGILQELTQLISNHLNIDIRRLDIEAHDEVFQADLTVLVEDTNVVNDLCNKIKHVQGVTKASRT